MVAMWIGFAIFCLVAAVYLLPPASQLVFLVRERRIGWAVVVALVGWGLPWVAVFAIDRLFPTSNEMDAMTIALGVWPLCFVVFPILSFLLSLLVRARAQR